MENQIFEVLAVRYRALEALRDIIRGHAERLVQEHYASLRELWGSDEFMRYRPRLKGSTFGFTLAWWASQDFWSAGKKVTRSDYLKQNKDCTYDPRAFKNMTPEERMLFDAYEPEYVKIRRVMAKLARESKVHKALLEYLDGIEGLDEWVLHLPPGKLPDYLL